MTDGNHVYTAHVVDAAQLAGPDSSPFTLNVLGGFHISDSVFTFGDGVHTLDLTSIPNDVLSGIETIDIGGNGANSITLNMQDVLDLSSASDDLRIKGTSDDTVKLIGLSNFSETQDNYSGFGDGVTYKVYENSLNGSHVYIGHDITNVIVT